MPGCNFAAFRFCCPTGCVYESDDFNRADSTSLGAKWTETAGDWSIDTNRLKIVATADAVCTCTTEHPTASTKYIVSVSVTLGTDGDIARMWVDDSAFFAELERITSTCGRLRLYDGATCKGSVNVALGGYTRLVLCSEGDKVHVGTGGSPMLTVPATVASSIVALGTGGTCTGTVYFEDFSLSKHADDDATCPACGSTGCWWLNDGGCVGESPSDNDWTITGTWTGYSGLKCTADGALTSRVEFPDGATGYHIRTFLWESWNNALPIGTVVSLTADAGVVELRLTVTTHGGWKMFQAQLFVSGSQHGPTVYSPVIYGNHVALCIDATAVSAYFRGTGGTYGRYFYFASASHTATSSECALSVSGLSGGAAAYFSGVFGKRVRSDCETCGPSCGCDVDTEIESATFVVSGLTSITYGCPCSDITFTMTPEGYGDAIGPVGDDECSLWGTAVVCGTTYTARATILPVTGGYKMRIDITGGFSWLHARFEETVLTDPVACNSDFNGPFTLVASNASAPCDFASSSGVFTAT